MFDRHFSVPLTFSPPDWSLLQGLRWSREPIFSHQQLAEKIADQQPCSITIILENLAFEFSNRKTHVKKTKIAIPSQYLELLHDYFNQEFGERLASERYGRWLDKHRPTWLREGKIKDLDDYVIENELEPRYFPQIKNRYRNIKKLKQPRYRIHRDRYYHLPKPLNRVDWRSPYDNLFIWGGRRRRWVTRGGSGSSGAREINSRFCLAFGLINQRRRVPSYLHVYNRENRLFLIKKFSGLTLPQWNIGANYHIDRQERECALKGVQSLAWNDFGRLKEISIVEAAPANRDLV